MKIKRKMAFLTSICMVMCLSLLVLSACIDNSSEKISISDSKLSLNIGDSASLHLLIGEQKQEDPKNIKWKTSDSTIAGIDNGNITAYFAGNCVITAVYNEQEYSCSVTVAETKSYSISKRALALGVEENSKLSMYFDDEIIQSGVIWESSNNGIATVDDGMVKGIATGECVITAEHEGNYVECVVTVENKFSLNVLNLMQKQTYVGKDKSSEYDNIIMQMGEWFKLQVEIMKEFESDSDILHYESSIPSVATIDNNGKIESVGGGITVISVTSKQEKEQANGEIKPFVVDFLLTVGAENDDFESGYFESLSNAELGYSYYGKYSWLGFNSDLKGSSTNKNNIWNAQNLHLINGEMVLNVYKDGYFVQETTNLPMKGYVDSVDTFAPEKTVGQAKEKYGNAYNSPFEKAEIYQGQLVFYENKLFLIATGLEDGTLLKNIVREIKTSRDMGFNPLDSKGDNYENLLVVKEVTSIDKEGQVIVDKGLQNIYESTTLHNNCYVRLDLYSDRTFTMYSIDSDNVYKATYSGVYQQTTDIVLMYYINGEANKSLLKSSGHLLSSVLGGISIGNISAYMDFSAVEIVGEFVSEIYILAMDMTFTFDLGIRSDGSYELSRRDVEGLRGEVIGTGVYVFSDGMIICQNSSNDMVFDIIHSRHLKSVGKITTSVEMEMSAELAFNKA